MMSLHYVKINMITDNSVPESSGKGTCPACERPDFVFQLDTIFLS